MRRKACSRRGFLKRAFASTAPTVFGIRTALTRQADPFDLLITGGTVVDGTGRAGFRADVGIRDGRIAALENLESATARQKIDARGRIVAPGFIDIHNHSDETLLEEPLCESMVRQGVTTMILGEGQSAGPVKPGEKPWESLGDYFNYAASKGIAVNIASYVGQGQVWTCVKGYEQQPATADELAEMSRLVDEAMQQGALGLSTSLLMPPANLVTTAQLATLAETARRRGGIYSTHIRDEGLGVFSSIDEAIEIGRRARLPVDIIHLKIAHREFWGRMAEVVALIRQAREEGLDIQANVYPYTAGQNDLVAIIPPWALDGGRDPMLKRLQDPGLRRRMRNDILNGLPGWYNHYLATGDGWDGMLLVTLSRPENRPFIGKRMGELIRSRGGDPVEVLFDLLIEEGGSVPAVYFHHSEADMRLALSQPFTSVGSDGAAVSVAGKAGPAHPHPRYYGTFPRVLGRYVREEQVLTLTDAIRKMTSLNAGKIGLEERGKIAPGFHADVTVFDAETVIDRATFERPQQYPEGIETVIVNGRVILHQEERRTELPGQVLRN